MSPILHGGRLIEAVRIHPDAPTPWIDLSTGINPAPYPFEPPSQAAWHRLPEPEQVQALETAASSAYGATDPAMVVAAPGTQALLQLLPRLLPQPAIRIATHTYAEHAATWRAAGSEVVQDGARARVVCNPNNPDGTSHSPQALAEIAQGLDLLVVDEAFADFSPELSLVPVLPLPGVVVLRSFGKAYGLAGLRLGFAIAEPGLATRLRTALGPWSVSGPAISIGIQALADTAWRAAAAQAAHAAATRLDRVLERFGLQILGGTSLFRLADTPNAAAMAHRLAGAGILVRRFELQPSWLRFGLPVDEPAWGRLAAALRP